MLVCFLHFTCATKRLASSINFGFRGRHLCTPDPGVDTILPVDDDALDQGILPSVHTQRLVSTSVIDNGRYARLAQATSLLSQVFRHISSHDDGIRLDLNDIAQLERTLFALEHLASFEEQERNSCNLSSMATCYRSITHKI